MKQIISILLIILACKSLYSENEFKFIFSDAVKKQIQLDNSKFEIVIQLDTFLLSKNNNGTYSILDKYDLFKNLIDNMTKDDSIRYSDFLILTQKFTYVFSIDLLGLKHCDNTMQFIKIEKMRKSKFNYITGYCEFSYYHNDGIRNKRK